MVFPSSTTIVSFSTAADNSSTVEYSSCVERSASLCCSFRSIASALVFLSIRRVSFCPASAASFFALSRLFFKDVSWAIFVFRSDALLHFRISISFFVMLDSNSAALLSDLLFFFVAFNYGVKCLLRSYMYQK